jgi:hypothetical protein
MSAVTDLLHRIIEELPPDTVRAEIVGGELIVTAAAPVFRHAHAVSRLRDAIGDVGGLIELERTTVALSATAEQFVPDLAYYRRDELDPDARLNPAGTLAMAVEVVCGREDGSSAWRDREHKARSYAASVVPLYFLIDEPRKTVVLHSAPHYVPAAEASRYSVTVRASFGESLDLPEPFSRTIDTSIFEC